MIAIQERVRAVKDRLAQRRATRRAEKPERAQRKADAEERRREHRRNVESHGGGAGSAGPSSF